MNETIHISTCHHTPVIGVLEYNPFDPDGEALVYAECSICHLRCDTEEVCAYCLGTGEVITMEAVYPGEPHMAPIGTKKCICQIKEDFEE